MKIVVEVTGTMEVDVTGETSAKVAIQKAVMFARSHMPANDLNLTTSGRVWASDNNTEADFAAIEKAALY